MSYDMRFSGVLTFPSSDDLEEATDEVEEIVAAEGADFIDAYEENAAEWFFEDGATLTVAIDTYAPTDWRFALERIVETYAAYAWKGAVDSWFDDQPGDSYGPDATDY